jgi:Restriction endonuclease S subunits
MVMPKLRFKTDDGSDFPDWEEKKLGKLTEKINRRGTNSTADIRMISQGNGFILQSDKYSRENAGESLKKYTLLKKNEFAYNHGASKMKPYGVCYRLCESDEARVPYVYHTFRFISEIEDFWNYALNTSKMDRQLKKIVSSGARMDGLLNIGYDAYMSVRVMVPALPEQQKIADFLSTIDTIIEKQRAMVSAWEERKKGVMQKLFSQEVRFKADDGSDFPDWEEKKMTDLFTRIVEKNRTDLPALTIIQGQGTVRRDESDRRISYDSKGLKNYKVVRKDNFIVHLRSFEGGLEIANQDGIVSPAYHVYQGNANVNPKFYYPYFRSNNFIRGHLAICVTGVRDGKNIEMNAFDELLLPCPSLPEQQKIADCLSALDAVIEKQKETLEKWQELKKGLLQQMFV